MTEYKKCKHCGQYMNNTDKFCQNCGAKNTKEYSCFGCISLIIVAIIVIKILTVFDNNVNPFNFRIRSNPYTGSNYNNTVRGLSEDEFKNSCIYIDREYYRDFLRNPSKHIGEKVCVQVSIRQVLNDGNEKYYFANGATGNESYSEREIWFGDDYCIVDKRPRNSTNIIVGDIVTVYGTFKGIETFTLKFFETEEEVPVIDIKYCDFNF